MELQTVLASGDSQSYVCAARGFIGIQFVLAGQCSVLRGFRGSSLLA